MKTLPTDFLEKSRLVFLTEAVPSLADLRKTIELKPPTTQRRDTLSALDSIPRKMGRALASVPATLPAVQALFSDTNGPQLGLSQKTFQNLRASVRKAVEAHGVCLPNLTARIPLTDEWTHLISLVQGPDYASGLRRLACFCSATGVLPLEVTSEVLLGFYEALVAEARVKDPKITLRLTTTYWNMQLSRVPAWPDYRLATPFPSNRYKLALKDLPLPLQKDIARWEAARLGADVLSLNKLVRESRPVTVAHQTGHILRYISLVVENNLAELHELQCLQDIVEPSLVKAALDILLNKMDRSKGYVHQYAYVLHSIARHHTKLPKKKVAQLSTLASNLKQKRKRGMTEKNRRCLSQFNRQENIDKLLLFSDEERRRGDRQRNKYREAKCYERALVVDLLIHSVLRMQNLSTLRLDRNFREKDDQYILQFADIEMKNGRPHSLAVSEEITSRIKEFVAQHRRHLVGAEGPYLFPGKDGRHRHHSAIRREFQSAVFKHCGFRVHPHLMRHFTARVTLDQDPNQIFKLSKQLAHADVATTQNYYLDSVSLRASQDISEILEKQREVARLKKKRKKPH